MMVIRHGLLAFDRAYHHDYNQIYGEQAREPGALNALDPSGPYNYFNSWWHPYYQRGDLHSLQSVTKTITSIIIGAAVARKEFPDLGTPILTFFDTTRVANIDDRKRRITIKHVLTMTAGLDWNEVLSYNDPKNSASQMEASSDWVSFTIDRPMASEPGTTFNYSSGVSELLGFIFCRATGRDIEEYAVEHLFKPLGIDRFYWKRTPSGTVDTEGGLYLRSEDLAKIFFLVLKNGIWNGRRILSQDWIKASVSPAMEVSKTASYGFQWWLFSYDGTTSHRVWAGSGFGGQMPMIIPEYDLVIIFNAWNILDTGARLRYPEAVRRVVNAALP